MLYVVVSMVVILLVAGAVVLYAAYPHRGERLPAAPWLGEAMTRAVESMPLLPAEEEQSTDHRLVDSLHRDSRPGDSRS